MPLYEMLVITRMADAMTLNTWLKTLTIDLLADGMVIRNIVNLGDRIMAKSIRDKTENKYHNSVG